MYKPNLFMKKFLFILLCYNSIMFSQTLNRVVDVEDYSNSTDVGFKGKVVEYNYKTFLKYKKVDLTYTYYEFDGQSFTEFTAGGALPSFTAQESGIINLYVNQDQPSIAYLEVVDDNEDSLFYQWDGATLTEITWATGMATNGFDADFYGNMDGVTYFKAQDENGNNILLKIVGATFEKVENPVGFQQGGAGVVALGGISDVDGLMYLKMKTDTVAVLTDSYLKLVAFDGESFTTLTPENYPTYNVALIEEMDGRNVFISLKDTANDIDLNEPFVYDVSTESFHMLSGHGAESAKGVTGAVTFNEETYFIYKLSNNQEVFYKINRDDYSISEAEGMCPDGFYIINFSSYHNFYNDNQYMGYRVRNLTTNVYNFVYTNGETTQITDNITYFGGRAKGIGNFNRVNTGDQKIYLGFTSSSSHPDYVNNQKVLYAYYPEGDSLSSSELKPNDSENFSGSNRGYRFISFIVGGNAYHSFQNTSGNNLLYTEADICIAKENTTAIDTAVTANSFIVPSGNYEVNSAGVYKDTISTVAGCDSIITLNVSFVTPPSVTSLSVVESASSVALEVTDHIYVEGETIFVKVGYSDNIFVSNILDSDPTISITSIDKELVYHSYQGTDVFFSYTITGDETVNTEMILADEIMLNGGELLNQNKDNNASLDISEVNNLNPNILTSTDDPLSILQHAISPNPFSDQINIDLSSIGESKVKLIDMNGVVLKELVNPVFIHTSDLSKGMYMLYIEGKKTSGYLKLIKN